MFIKKEVSSIYQKVNTFHSECIHFVGLCNKMHCAYTSIGFNLQCMSLRQQCHR